MIEIMILIVLLYIAVVEIFIKAGTKESKKKAIIYIKLIYMERNFSLIYVC